MIKGVKFDYDLRANNHVGNNKCIICENVLSCRWTDLNGEGVCLQCGASYQLINGSEQQIKESKYPYINIIDKWIPILKEYWNETHNFVFNGTSFSEDTGRKEFHEWLKIKHSELLKD